MDQGKEGISSTNSDKLHCLQLLTAERPDPPIVNSSGVQGAQSRSFFSKVPKNQLLL